MKSSLLLSVCLGVSAMVHVGLFDLPVSRPVAAVKPPDRTLDIQVSRWQPVPPPEVAPPEPVTKAPESETITPAPMPPAITAPPVSEPVAAVESEALPEPVPDRVEAMAQVVTDLAPDVTTSYWNQVCNEIADHLYYPVSARRSGRSCHLVLHLVLGPQGELYAAEPRHVVGDPGLVRAALKAVRDAAPFSPPPQSLPTPVAADLPIRYQFTK